MQVQRLILVFLFLSWFWRLEARAAEPVSVVWNKELPSLGATALPNLAFDSTRQQLLVVWNDARNDPAANPDGYGPDYNADIYGRLVNATDGSVLGEEVVVANRGRYRDYTPPRYDNETYPEVVYDQTSDKYALTWMMLPDSVLEVYQPACGLWNQSCNSHFMESSCNDVAFRTYDPRTNVLSPPLLDLARIPTSSPDFAFSCQLEPVIARVAGGRSLLVWQDYRSHSALAANGQAVLKDLYSAFQDNANPVVNEPVVNQLWTEPSGQRAAEKQEFPQIAQGRDKNLLVWSDNRQGAAGVYGQFFDTQGQAMGNNFRIIASEAGGINEVNYLFRPEVAYLASEGVFYLVVDKRLTAHPTLQTKLLVAAVKESDGSLLAPARELDGSESNFWAYPAIACHTSRCLIAYIKNNIVSLLVQQAGLDFTAAGTADNYANAFRDYPKMIAGGNFFYLVYDLDLFDRRGRRVRLAKVAVGSSGPSSSPTSAPPTPTGTPLPAVLGLGQCHMGNIYNSSLIKWTYPSSEALWNKLNPKDGVFDFRSLDAEVDKNKSRGEKIWLQVLTDHPHYTTPSGHCEDVVPRWLAVQGVPVHEWTDNYGQKCLDGADPWHPLYRQKLQEMLYQLHKHYEIERWSDYQKTLEAVLIMAGGSYGEMVLDITKKDLYLDWMAAKTGLSPDHLGVQRGDSSYVLDDYFVLEVQAISDLYAQTFRRLPVVLQLGSGLGYSSATVRKVTDYLAPKWRNHLWFKYNAWGSNLDVDRNFFKVMQDYTAVTLNHVEQGHDQYWCGADKTDHNRQAVTMATGNDYPAVKAVSACILPQVLQAGANCPLDYAALAASLSQNGQTAQARGLYPAPTLAPAAATKVEVLSHLYLPESQYDLNFDGLVNALDFVLAP